MLEAFHLRKLRSICNITWKDKITNHEVLSRCQISGIEACLLKSQLRWTGHVIRMSDDRLPKILLYGQLAKNKRPVGRPRLRYKDKLKDNLASLKLPLATWEKLALQRDEWRAACHQHVSSFEDQRCKEMLKDREERKAPPAAIAANLPFVCSVCGKICKSNAELHSHRRSQHPPASTSTAGDDTRRTCRICKKVCKNEHGLKIHLRVHR